MNNVACILLPHSNIYGTTPVVEVYRDEVLVGVVECAENAEEPTMTIFGRDNGKAYLTLGDMDIIQDNWNQLQEMQKKS